MIDIPLWAIALLAVALVAPWSLPLAFGLRLWHGPFWPRLAAGAGLAASAAVPLTGRADDETAFFAGLAGLLALGLAALLAWGRVWWIEPLGLGALGLGVAGLAVSVLGR